MGLVARRSEGCGQVSIYGVKLERSDDLRLTRHPEGCTEDSFVEWCSQRLALGERLAVDLFSGAGGLSLGLEDAGWTVAAAVDHDEKAIQTHRHNFPGLALGHDLSDPVERRELIELFNSTDVDLVAGGPPCQPFSRAGRSKIRSLVVAGHRDEHDSRRELWQAFLDVALGVRPRAVLMENVPDMALGDDFAVVRTIVDALEREGYYTETRLVDAWRYGVPQHRKRLILLARRDVEIFDWPIEGTDQPTLREAIGDLPNLDGTTGGRELRYSKPRRLPSFAQAMRLGARNGVVWDHMTRPVRDDDRKIFGMMDASTLYSDLPERLRRYSADTFDDKYKKLDWESVSRSITAHIAKDGYWYIHPQELRTLTVREAARVQTFPDRFRFAGTRSDAFRQIGNAVPPLLGHAAAVALRPVRLDACSSARPRDASQWVVARQTLTHWARQQQRSSSWYILPGEGVTVAVAALSAALLGRSNPSEAANRVFASIRGRTRLTKADIDRIQLEFPTRANHKVLERFRQLLPKRNLWEDPEALVENLAMKSGEERVFRLLIGQDVLFANQATLRVAARVSGTSSDSINRLSNGRVDLARLVGAGPDAPLRASALRLLGSTICRAPTALCGDCPLRPQCVSADNALVSQALW